MTRPEMTKPHGGNREASENTTAWASDSEGKHTPHAAELRILALSGLDDVPARLARYALTTNAPALGIVEAADLLDAASAALGGTP